MSSIRKANRMGPTEAHLNPSSATCCLCNLRSQWAAEGLYLSGETAEGRGCDGLILENRDPKFRMQLSYVTGKHIPVAAYTDVITTKFQEAWHWSYPPHNPTALG